MKILLAIIILLSLTLLSKQILIESDDKDIRHLILETFKDGPQKELFKVYHFLYKKEYELDSEEGIRRYRIFKNTVKFIEDSNSKNLSYKLGLNKFSDLSDEEFRNQYLGFQVDNLPKTFLQYISFDEYAEKEDSYSSEEISNNLGQTKIDWNTHFGPAKDQGSCGSCWAFASVGAIEGNYSLNFKKKLTFAEQQLVDCSNYTNGCKGSDPKNAMKYILEKGLAYQNEYTYLSGLTTTPGTCIYTKIKPNQILTGTESCGSTDCTRAKIRSMLTKGPIVATIDGEGNGVFKSYKSGILDMPCSKSNHAIILTGLDTNGSREYYMGRNSWGDDWGDKGFFKIYVRDSDKSCFLETYGVLPLVKETKIPEPPAPAPECLKLYSNCYLKGTSVTTCDSVPDISMTPYGFTIGKFKKVLLFTGPKCTNSFYTFEKSLGCISDVGINYQLKSLLIVDNNTPPTGCIWAYDSYCLSGNRKEICADVADLGKLTFAKKISSMKIGPGIKSVSVFSDKDFYGTYTSYNSDKFSLFGSSLDKNVLSIKFTK